MGKARTEAVLPLAILLACCTCSFALDPSLDVSQYAHTAWKVRDGFSKGVITSLAQTPDGYLWVGTESGLLRFDGVRAVPWQPPSGQQLPGNLITALLTARDGTLWIGTFTGLASWKDGRLMQLRELAGRSVTSLLEARDGTVWIGIYADSGGTVCDIRSGPVHCDGSDMLATGVKALYEDSKGTLWLGSQNGVWRWRPGTPEFFSIRDEPFGIIGFAEDEQGQLLFSSHAGIRRLVDGPAEPYPSKGPAYHWQITRMLRDHDGGLWVGTSEHGLKHFREQGKVDTFSAADSLSGDYVTRFLEDREGNIWVSTFDGLDRFRAYSIPTISTKQGLSSAVPWSVLASKDGSVWIAGNSGLNHWQNGQISLFGNGGERQKSDGKIDGRPPDSPFQDSSGRIWVSNNIGEVGYLQDDRFIPIRGLPRGNVSSIAEVPLGHLWIANDQAGLFQLFEGRVVQHIPWAGLGRKDFARVIIADPSQRGLWLGFRKGGVADFADGTIRASYSTENGLGEGRVSDLRFGTRGALWAATATGLSRIKDGHVSTLSSKNGLPCDQAVATMEDNDGSTWLYLACGLVRISRAELDAWVANPRRVIKFELFDTSDGVRSHVSAGGYQPLMTKSADGKIWFLPWDGVSVIDPHHIPFNKLPPPVHIEQVVANRKTYDTGSDTTGNLRLPPLIRDLEIDYTALSLVAPEKVRFRYKLEGLDRDWQDVGNRRQAYYTNLPPRHYRFRVAACNNSGVWNEAGTFLDFSVDPAYYQTWWFRSLCVATFLGLLAAAHQLRLRQVAHQFNMRLEERVSERTRIARDFHDTLLQSFQGVLLKFHAVTYLLHDRPEAQKTLETVIEQARQAVTEGRDAVQGLRSSTVIKNDLTCALAQLGERLAAEQNGQNRAAFHVDVGGESRDLHPILRDEVCRIASESIRNAFHHSGASRIEVEISYGERQLRVRVRDNGKGIDPKVLDAGGRAGHHGLPGMHERTQLVGGKLAVWSELDSGTEVELTIPASSAYAKSLAARRSMFWKKGA